MECLELTIVNSLIEKLKNLYQLKNKQINSYLLFLYEKIDSGLVRDLEKLIPERNIISNLLMKKPEKRNEELNKIELYSSIYSGYGKTTEIKYNVKSKNGEYKYLPIGGAFSRDYIINNLYNLKINFQNAKNIYLIICHVGFADGEGRRGGGQVVQLCRTIRSQVTCTDGQH